MIIITKKLSLKHNLCETLLEEIQLRVKNKSGIILGIFVISLVAWNLSEENANGIEFYYSTDGSFIGKMNNNSGVRVVDSIHIKSVKGYIIWANNSSPDAYQSYATNQAKKLSKDVGMTNDEMNTRAFLSMIKQAENRGNEPLKYNVKHFVKGKVANFTNKTYEEAPEDYKEHPYKGKRGSTPAGAYQTLNPTFQLYKKAFPEDITDFGPKSQDKITLGIFAETKALLDIKNGNLYSAVKKLTSKPVQFASLPGGGQSNMGMASVRKLFKKNIALELSGNSNIALPKGETLNSIPKRKN